MTFLPSKIPLIQAPMAGAQGPDLAIAVCRAGGLGSLPSAMLTPDLLREQIAAVRGKTEAPFNVNFFCHAEPATDPAIEARWRARLAPYYAEAGVDPSGIRMGPARAPFDEAMCVVVEEARPAVVSFHFGLPHPGLLARVMFLSDDIDAQPGLISLLPQMCDAVRLPVVAAGGIGDGRGIAAAFALGADAVQIGTAYLRTPEALISPIHRAALASARDDATRLTNVFTGRPARGLLNRLVAGAGPICLEAPPFPLAAGAVAPLREAAEKRGSGDFSPLWAGEAAALAREKSAETLTHSLWTDALAVMRNLNQ
jgi:nitronate monooxygenase